MTRGLLMLLAATICARVEATVFLKPNLTNFIVNVPVTLECDTHESVYSSLSFSFSPPPGQKVNGQPSSITSLRGGGIKRSITFTMTTGLNGTKVVCSASDIRTNLFAQSRRATIFGQEFPNLNGKFSICNLSDHLFFNWNPVFQLEGIVIQYRITYNHQNMTIDVTRSKQPYPIGSGSYRGNITVIVEAAAAKQTTYEEPMHNVSITNVSLNLNEMSIYKENATAAKLNFTVKLNETSACSFNSSVNGKLTVCNNSICDNFTATIEYRNGMLISSCNVNLSRLASGRRFQSRLCFEYAGEEIDTNNITTNLYELQDIINITENCLNIHMIKGWTTPKIYLRFSKSGEKILEHQVNVLGQNFNQCSPISLEYNKTHNISFSYGKGSGSWDLHAYDYYNDFKMEMEPAVKLHNINSNFILKETSPSTELHVPSATTETSASTIQEARVGVILLLLFVSIIIFIII